MVYYPGLLILLAAYAATASIPTSAEWKPCFANISQIANVNITCANLTVPLDYLNSSNPKTTYIRAVRVRSNNVPKPSEALFVNYGGKP